MCIWRHRARRAGMISRRLACAWVLAAWMLAGCAGLPPPVPLPASHAVHNASRSPLATLAASDGAAVPDGGSGFRLLPEGSTSFNARIELLRQARLTVDVQYYVLQNDAVGGRFLKEIMAAAERGVRVRILVDGLYVAGKDELYSLMALQPNIEIRVFNPLPVQSGPLAWRLVWSAWEVRRIHRRMHNKLFVVDNTVAVVGGRNIADEYFMQSGTANFIDLDVLVTGPLVRELSSSFDAYWASKLVWPVGQSHGEEFAAAAQRAARIDRLLAAALPGLLPERVPDVLGQQPISREISSGRLALTWAKGSLAVDPPEKILRPIRNPNAADSLHERVLSDIASSREQVILVSPYFIPGERGVELLRDLAGRGVETLILTNGADATDESLVYAKYSRYRDSLLRMGARIYELGGRLSASHRHLGDFGLSGGRLHAKVGLLDRHRLLIGSMNLDARSARVNTEIGVAIDSQVLGRQFEQLAPVRALDAYEVRLEPGDALVWVERRQDGSEHVHRGEPGRGWGVRLKDFLLEAFVPEDLL